MKTLRRAILVPTLVLGCVVAAVLALLSVESMRQARALAREADAVRSATSLAVALGSVTHEEEHRMALLASIPGEPGEGDGGLAEADARIAAHMEALRGLPLSSRAAGVFVHLEEARDALRVIARQALAARRGGDEAALARALDQWLLMTGRSDALLDDFTAFHLRLLDRTVADLQGRRARALWIAGAAIFLGLLLAAGFALAVARAVVRPIVEMAAAAERVTATGPPARVGDPGRQDEIGTLARAFERMTERLVSANASLSAAVRAREEFISIASHELKTPITPLQLRIQQLVRLLRDAPDDDAAARGRALHAARNLEKHVASLARLVANLLDVSQIASGGIALRREECSTFEVVRDAAARVADDLAAAGCELRLECERDAGLHADRSRLEQVFVNLLVNAAKYAPGAPVTVRVARDGAGGATVSVTDRGPGIAAEDRARIFARFERAAGREVSGLGLGLFIAHEIVAAHGGALGVESEPGRGATFVVRLPAA